MGVALRLCAVAIVLTIASFAQKPDKPDFSGTWQLDVQRTRFGAVAQPHSLVIQIEHHEPQVRILTVAVNDKGEEREMLDLTTNGKQHALTLDGKACTANAHWHWWSGKRLVVEVNRPGSYVSRRFTLGANGKILTTILTVKDGSGEKTAYEFFFRQ